MQCNVMMIDGELEDMIEGNKEKEREQEKVERVDKKEEEEKKKEETEEKDTIHCTYCLKLLQRSAIKKENL